jgi:hypothetical protein
VRHNQHRLLGPGRQLAQDRLAPRENHLARVAVAGGRGGGGLVREEGVDGGEVDGGEEGGEGGEAGTGIAGLGGVFCGGGLVFCSGCLEGPGAVGRSGKGGLTLGKGKGLVKWGGFDV